MKKIFYSVIYFFLIIQANASLREEMLPNDETERNVGIDGDGTTPLTNLLVYIKDFMFNILWIIAVGVFLYFGFRLITARGNEEDFKKTLVGFVYAIVGLAIIPLAWGVVKLIASLDF